MIRNVAPATPGGPSEPQIDTETEQTKMEGAGVILNKSQKIHKAKQKVKVMAATKFQTLDLIFSYVFSLIYFRCGDFVSPCLIYKTR